MKQGRELCPVEVEIYLSPGLPQVQILGLPDQALRESTIRIKAAIRACGLQFPKARQVIVNLRPAHVRKNSRGIELAIAVGILQSTGQLSPRVIKQFDYVYGELTLDGGVGAPEDFADLPQAFHEQRLLTGGSDIEFPFGHWQIDHLRQLETAARIEKHPERHRIIERPPLTPHMYPKNLSRVVAAIAHGEHPVYFFGPPGVGKTTLVEQIAKLAHPPGFFAGLKDDLQMTWRPWLQPHHSATSLSLIGGGKPIQAGEISRADGGILILDELLEFDPHVQESLREPFERGRIRVTRVGDAAEFPARFFCLATSNLCQCGRTSSVAGVSACSCGSLRRRRYLQRLSGPLLDRFHALIFMERSPRSKSSESEDLVSVNEILDHVNEAGDFARLHGRSDLPNAWLDDIHLPRLSAELPLTDLGLDQDSERRRRACVRLARSFADLDRCVDIQPRHVREAFQFSVENFRRFRFVIDEI